MQPVATNLVTERIRDRLDLLDRSEGHRLRRRVPLEDRLIHRDDPRDLRLVLQDLGDEDRVWVARSAPGKIATVCRVPGEDAALEGAAAAPTIRRSGPSQRSGRRRDGRVPSLQAAARGQRRGSAPGRLGNAYGSGRRTGGFTATGFRLCGGPF